MKKKTIVISVFLAALVLLSSGPVSAKCSANSNINVGIKNTSVLIGSQYSSSTNVTGLNSGWGNIGAVTIVPGAATSTTTQTMVGGSTTNVVNLTGGSTTNTVNVLNTGHFANICN